MNETGGRPRRLRLFVACDLPDEALRAVSEWQRRELGRREELRTSASLHLTLAFLGDQDPASVPDIERALSSVRWEPVTTHLAAPLFLPQRGAKHVVALALEEEAGKLIRLQADVAEALTSIAVYSPGRRPWLPHVTVARFRRPGHPFSLQNVNIGEFGVVRMVLYSSLLERAGAVHTPLAVFPAS